MAMEENQYTLPDGSPIPYQNPVIIQLSICETVEAVIKKKAANMLDPLNPEAVFSNNPMVQTGEIKVRIHKQDARSIIGACGKINLSFDSPCGSLKVLHIRAPLTLYSNLPDQFTDYVFAKKNDSANTTKPHTFTSLTSVDCDVNNLTPLHIAGRIKTPQ